LRFSGRDGLSLPDSRPPNRISSICASSRLKAANILFEHKNAAHNRDWDSDHLDGRGGIICRPNRCGPWAELPRTSDHGGSFINSIVFTHINAPVAGASILDIALHRLGAWLDAERNTLDRVLAQTGQWQAAKAFETLDQLHLEPESTARDLRDLLEHARTCLEFLLETLRAIPRRCGLRTAWGLPGPDTLDTHVRWSGARLEDILTTLERALAV